MISPKRIAAAGILVFSLAAAPVRAELNACDVHPCLCHMWHKGDTPDPFPWGATLGNGRGAPLNLDGDQRGDMWPDFGINPVTHQAEVVWAFNDGSDYEIAFARTEDGHWGPITLLTANAQRDVDARLAFDASTGGSFVTFWTTDGTAVVKLIVRPSPTSAWTQPEPVSAGVPPARLPAVLVAGAELLVGYEEDAAAGGRDLVLASRSASAVPGTVFYRQTIGHTDGSRSAHLILDVVGANQTVFAAWIQSETEIGYSIFNGVTWEPPRYVPYADGLDIEMVRMAVRRIMVSPRQ